MVKSKIKIVFHDQFALLVKISLIYLFLLQAPFVTKAAISYDFVASSGAFTPNATPTTIHAAGVDDALSAAINIGFTFNFGGCTSTSYTQVKVSSNGWVSLGTGATGFQSTNDMAWTVYGPLLAPLWDDLKVNTGGSINYQLTGTSPNRVFTVEFKNMAWNWSSASSDVSFQVKLYETSNRIEYIYRDDLGSLNSTSASIGINGGVAGDYYSLNNTSSNPSPVYGTATNNLSTRPATGQIYTWNPSTTMTYTSATVTQANTTDVYNSGSNQEILAIAITVTGGCTPFNLTQMIINMTGTTLTSDVTNIDVYYTGVSSTYTATNLFGSVAPSGGSLTVNGSQVLQNGTNYFWVVYDISATPTLGDLLDAQCTQITMDGGIGNKIPSVTDPAGSRPIVSAPSSFAKWVEKGWMKATAEATGGNIVWGGLTTNTYSSGSSDAYLIQTTNDLSSVVWSATIGTAAGSERFEDIVKTADGFIGVGYSTMAGGAGGNDILVTKVNNSGVVQWTKLIGSASSDQGFGICLISSGANAGDVAITGQVIADDGYFAIISNATGAIIDQRTFSYPSAIVTLNDIVQTADGGYLMGGKARISGNDDFYLVKITSTYTLDFSRSWGGGSSDEIYFVLENASNDYTIGGATYSYGAGSSDGYIMRFTWGGGVPTFIWTNTVGAANGDKFTDGEKTLDGGYIMSGITTRLGDPLNNEAYIVKLNSSGNIVFLKSIGTSVASEDEEGYDVLAMSDGSYVVAGLHNDAVGGHSYLMKFSSSGYNCSIVQDNGGITNLIAPAFTTNGSIATPAYVASTPVPILGSGGVIVGGCVTTPMVLPIELASFNVNCIDGHVLSEWSTFTEINNDYFTIERSLDGVNFKSIGTISGAGNSNNIKYYSFIDDSRLLDIAYYRIKQTDFNGNYEYFITKASNCQEKKEINIYPNPFQNEIKISFNESIKIDYKIEIKNYLGQIVGTYSALKNSEGIKINIENNLTKGIYFIQILNKSEIIHTQKIIKL